MDAQRRIHLALLALVAVVMLGTFGYMTVEDIPPLQGLYMTVITITTVGFSEVVPLSDAGRVFTMILILTGFGCLTFFGHSFIEAVMERALSGREERKKMKRRIKGLKGHQIICGFGRMGMAAAEEFRREGSDFVVIESRPEQCEELNRRGYPHIVGDATSEDHLIEAGLARAKGLLAILPSDAGNLFITLTARELNPIIRIVARVEEPSSCKKLIRAGADHVLSPFTSAGIELARDLLTPETSGHNGGDTRDVQATWVAAENRPEIVGKSIGEATMMLHGEILGLRREGVDVLCPNPQMRVGMADQLLFLESISSEAMREKEEELSEYLARVLVAVESPRLSALYARVLRRVGCLPMVTHSGREALSLISAERPEVALVDQSLPDLAGVEVLRRIRALDVDQEVKMILLTDEEGNGSGDGLCLSKDSDPNEMVAMVVGTMG
ncbi:NAD-binding protein [Candidatus Sumerlaeota bacterium]|nr:NAD-binding protein [Candidatus Sumerlaeota bacterium]